MCADIRDGRGQLLPSKGRIQMSKTNYLQAVISDLQRTAGPYRCAINDISHRGKQRRYSITSSARAMSDGGTVRSSVLAVLRLIASSYLVADCTGKSAGFSPLRMRST